MSKLEMINMMIKEHFDEYLSKKNLEEKLFLSKNVCFAIKDLYDNHLSYSDHREHQLYKKDIIDNASDMFLLTVCSTDSILDFLEGNETREYVFYEDNPSYDEEVVMNKYKKEIVWAAKHYILAHKGLAKKLFEFEDQHNCSYFSSVKMENIIMRYWLVEENLYETFLDRKQKKSKDAFDDYLFHAALSDITVGRSSVLYSQGFIENILKSKDDVNASVDYPERLESKVIKYLSSQDFDFKKSHANKIYNLTKELVLKINDRNGNVYTNIKEREEVREKGATFFLNYEFFRGASFYQLNGEELKERKELNQKVCEYLECIKKPNYKIFWEDNKLVVELDKEIFFINHNLKQSIVSALDKVFLNNTVDAFELKLDTINIYNQSLDLKYIYEITCAKDIENYEENKVALEKVTTLIFEERCKSYNDALNFKENATLSYDSFFREYLLTEIMNKSKASKNQNMKRKI